MHYALTIKLHDPCVNVIKSRTMEESNKNEPTQECCCLQKFSRLCKFFVWKTLPHLTMILQAASFFITKGK